MISAREYLEHDGLSLAALVRRKELQASEVIEAAIARADAVHARLNAIVIPMYDEARQRAASELSGPFAGVPFLLKDLFQDYAGVPASNGCAAYRRASYRPRAHSEIVKRWLAAGTVILGRTNTPEFGAKGTTEPEAWGPTRNPWQLERSPGGSSGGSAAAVAAGIVPLAGASDGGGSIRIPAASTGLFGLKPGRGRTPLGPDFSEAMHGAAVNHVLSRSVRDSACMLDATHGPEPTSAFRIAPPERPYLEEVEREPRRLRIAWSARSPLGPVDAEVERAVARAVQLLAGLGHEVVPAEPAIDGRELLRDFLTLWFCQLGVHLAHTRALLGARDRDFEIDSIAMEAIGRARRASDYAESYERWNGVRLRLAAFLAHHDVYLTPTLAEKPPRIGALATPPLAAKLARLSLPLGLRRLIPMAARTVEEASLANLRGVPFTQLANVCGVPAMSVPLDSFEDGMPLGIQFLANHGDEGLLFSLAGQLERAAPWRQRRAAL